MIFRRAFVRFFAVLLAVLAAPATRANAEPPINPSWVEPTIIGTVSGVAPLSGTTPNEYRTRILDVNMTPIEGSLVRLDFSATTIRLYGVQNSGTTVNCAARTLSRLSDAQGYATFVPRFGGFTNSNQVEVSADGVVLALVKARSVDIDAADGQVGLVDFASFAEAFLSVSSHPEMNFGESASDIPDLGDFAVFVDQYLRSDHGNYCP